MSVSWSIAGELCKLGGAAKVSEALRRLGVLESDEVLGEIAVVSDWKRGGAETYIFSFDVITQVGRRIRLMLKACVPCPGPLTVGEVLKEWVRRRHLLAREGVPAPHLYFAGEGVILEDREPFLVENWLQDQPRDQGAILLVVKRLINVAKTFDRLGFAPVAFVRDIMTDGQTVYVIDFGQDLGPEGTRFNTRHCEEEACAWVESLGLGIDVSTIRQLRADPN